MFAYRLNPLRRLGTTLVLALTFMTVACGTAAAAPGDGVVLRFAVLGDAEPKPRAEFPNLQAAVRDVNALAARERLDVVVGVGDIAHKGTKLQYRNVTPVLQALSLPFFPIMGNEEWNSTEARFLVFASPDFSRDFRDEGIDWILQQVRAASPRPVFLIVHGAQADAYPEKPGKGITHRRFAEVVAQHNLAAVISGDLHMDLDRVVHSKRIAQVHYVHIPGIERTKIPDETRHTPMFRVFTVTADGAVLVQTYQVGVREALARHDYRFSLPVVSGSDAAAARLP